MGRILLIAALAILLAGERAMPCVITNVSPVAAGDGQTITLNGSGFTGATSVMFETYFTSKTASFTVLSDSQISVTVPKMGPYGACYITVFTPTGIAVTVDSTTSVAGSGETINLGADEIGFVQSGGTMNLNGVASCTCYVQDGGTLGGTGGGSDVAYAEPGATLNPNADVTVVSVPQITESPISALFQYEANPPAVTTDAATNVGISGATANGTVNTEVASTFTYFQYGSTLAYGSQTALQHLTKGTQTVPVSASLSSLTANTLYHYQLVAYNTSGTSYGTDQTFVTVGLTGGFPGVVNVPTSGVSYNGATLNAIVNPNAAETSVYFEYGLSGTYGSTTATQSIGNGVDDVPVNAPLAGLLPNTTYHYCVMAANASGTTSGGDQTFQTGAVGISGISPAGAPAGATLTLSGLGFTTTTSVLFQNLGTSTSASFVVLSDTQMTVTVPKCGVRGGGYYITVITSAGLTVTLDPATAILENGTVAGSGGGVTEYLEPGSTLTNDGDGSCTYYVKSGATLAGTGGGGGNVAYTEPGAIVTFGGASVVSVPLISQSPVPTLFQFLAPGRAVTGGAASVAMNAATTTGTVNAEGTATTACMQYGPDTGSGDSSPSVSAGAPSAAGQPVYTSQTASQSIGSGTSDMPLVVNLSGLTEGTLYHFRVAVTNGAGTTYGADQEFTTNPGPFDNWTSTEFNSSQLSNPAISGNMANPSGDGISNLMKYALGMNPNASSTSSLPVSGTATVNGTNYATFTYTKMDAATDITYLPQWSTDLNTWTNSGLIETILSDNGTSQQVQDSLPVNGSQPVFFRLQVTMP